MSGDDSIDNIDSKILTDSVLDAVIDNFGFEHVKLW